MKRKKLLIFTLVTSVGGLAVDRVFLGEGGPAPAAASPQDLMAMGEAALAATPANTQARATSSEPRPDLVRGLVARLGGNALGGDPLGQSDVADAFADAMLAANANTPVPNEPPASPSAERRPRLSAVLLTGTTAAAVIDGHVLKPGEERLGLRLLSVSPDAVEIIIDGRTSSLPLPR